MCCSHRDLSFGGPVSPLYLPASPSYLLRYLEGVRHIGLTQVKQVGLQPAMTFAHESDGSESPWVSITGK